jgi:UDP-N-acetylmuramate--alanine ligase
MNIMTDNCHNWFFIGVAGSGMSALAQFLSGTGAIVSGSDRLFQQGVEQPVRIKLEAAGIRCFEQDGSGITSATECVVVSTAVEETTVEYRKAVSLGIPILQRSDLLAMMARRYRTIAVAGTSGKSTTTAMVYEILRHAGLSPSIISGAGLTSLIREGRIGNASVGEGEWLVIEADESDGSITKYHPTIGVLLNIDKDHKDINSLIGLFHTFRMQSEQFVVNSDHGLAQQVGGDGATGFGFGADLHPVFHADGFRQDGLAVFFNINGVPFHLHTVGLHNVENALAAVAAASLAGVSIETASKALESYEGIYRRHQVLGRKNGVWVIDDFAHNPVKCARSIQACQPLAPKVIAWFQPHGYGPTRFLRHDFVQEIAAVLRPADEIWMSEIYYAGGTAVKDISAGDLIDDLKREGVQACFVPRREDLPDLLRPHLTGDCVLLLMGARDPSLDTFAAWIYENL